MQQIAEEVVSRGCPVTHLKDLFPKLQPLYNPMNLKPNSSQFFGQPDGNFLLQEKYYKDPAELHSCFKFVQATPTRQIYSDPQTTRACIVTCGSEILPGLNLIIRSLVKNLEQTYAVK
jgi:hypothetical protein